MPHAGPHMLDYDLAHVLGAGVLLFSFAQLYQRRVIAMANAYAAQSVLLAAAAFWQGWVQGATELYVTGALTLIAKGLLIPLALHWIVRRLDAQRSIDPVLGVFPTMAIGVAMVTLAILVILPMTISAAALAREDLALALSVVLLGLLAMITRRTVLPQVVGFLSLENGLILAAIGVVGMPLLVELSIAVLVLVATAVFGLLVRRMRERFASLELHHLDRVGGAQR
ncbi:MAG TPA: hydrogenase-4 component E [Acetobacteraceae bacterium]|nr:hydrogenase-4 component E [Acetobacteraceae bacterium]